MVVVEGPFTARTGFRAPPRVGARTLRAKTGDTFGYRPSSLDPSAVDLSDQNKDLYLAAAFGASVAVSGNKPNWLLF